MFRALFARLTGEPKRGAALFVRAVQEARLPHWYVEGQVPDTVNGRFAVLATVTALILLRLEQSGPEGAETSVALTERFVESLDVEVREMGVSDPVIGKQVRKLVGALAGRIDRLRPLVAADEAWTDEVRRSLYLDGDAAPAAVGHSEASLKALWARLAATDLNAVAEGSIA